MKKVSIFTLSLILASNAFANALNGLSDVKVLVFTSEHYPISQTLYADHLYQIDAVERLQTSFFPTFSADPDVAEQEIRQLMQTPKWKQFETALQDAYQSVITGWKLGVKKIPAIVFEAAQPKDNCVIYGESDVAKAIDRYLVERKTRKTE